MYLHVIMYNMYFTLPYNVIFSCFKLLGKKHFISKDNLKNLLFCCCFMLNVTIVSNSLSFKISWQRSYFCILGRRRGWHLGYSTISLFPQMTEARKPCDVSCRTFCCTVQVNVLHLYFSTPWCVAYFRVWNHDKGFFAILIILNFPFIDSKLFQLNKIWVF